ncbi:hypothetical protein XH99_16840 [Bradyrhizobium nanningense]|uniref:Uncharacterized protein n=1 Tax=Bradyrhizobium nanningense TaxID=1325118 RepID=A0A4Q0S2C3_9BRAD|nr:hypothetical protein XH84_34220 [Bradyrhizobium nanningense]RXH27099.1 hypothetical protein XH99_16840 [Bradyrhizobium nanningense]TQF31990.1 hypothetical protein UNPA324_22015 [Bradyrhizobium sp. UNPA324]
MTKIFKHRPQVFAAYKQLLRLFAVRCAEGVPIPHIPDMVHSFTALNRSFLDKFEMFEVMRELIQLGD